MHSQTAAIRQSTIRGYAAFVVCGLCVALNLIFYLPAKTFEQAEVTEFTVTLALLAAFIISSIFASGYAIKNRHDLGLVSLFSLSIVFVILICASGLFSWQARSALQLCYAIIVLGSASVRLLSLRRPAI